VTRRKNGRVTAYLTAARCPPGYRDDATVFFSCGVRGGGGGGIFRSDSGDTESQTAENALFRTKKPSATRTLPESDGLSDSVVAGSKCFVMIVFRVIRSAMAGDRFRGARALFVCPPRFSAV